MTPCPRRCSAHFFCPCRQEHLLHRPRSKINNDINELFDNQSILMITNQSAMHIYIPCINLSHDRHQRKGSSSDRVEIEDLRHFYGGHPGKRSPPPFVSPPPSICFSSDLRPDPVVGLVGSATFVQAALVAVVVMKLDDLQPRQDFCSQPRPVGEEKAAPPNQTRDTFTQVLIRRLTNMNILFYNHICINKANP